jgi:hypothetical protein
LKSIFGQIAFVMLLTLTGWYFYHTTQMSEHCEQIEEKCTKTDYKVVLEGTFVGDIYDCKGKLKVGENNVTDPR